MFNCAVIENRKHCIQLLTLRTKIKALAKPVRFTKPPLLASTDDVLPVMDYGRGSQKVLPKALF